MLILRFIASWVGVVLYLEKRILCHVRCVVRCCLPWIQIIELHVCGLISLDLVVEKMKEEEGKNEKARRGPD